MATGMLNAAVNFQDVEKAIEALKKLIDESKAAAQQLNNAGQTGTASFQKINAAAGAANQSVAKQAQLGRNLNDSFNSLITGGNPLQVLVVQGNQIREMYGGSIPAALKAVGGLVGTVLLNPIVLATAAIGAFVVAAYQGAQESSNFARAIAVTGNQAGVTSGYLSDLSKSLTSVSGSQAKTAEILTAVVKSGDIAVGSYGAVTAAIEALERTGGQSIEKSVEMFSKLSDKPVESALKLNKELNFLNVATYDRIKALEEQGRSEEATAVAQTTLAQTMMQRMQAVRSEAGLLERTWNVLGLAAKMAWADMVSIGRAETATAKLAKLRENLTAFEQSPVTPGFSKLRESNINNLKRQIADIQGAENRTALNAANSATDALTAKYTIEAKERLDAQKKAMRSRQDLRAEELKQLKLDATQVGMAGDEYNRRASAIEEKYKDPKTPKAKAVKAFQDDAGTKLLQNIRDQTAATNVQLASEERLVGAAKDKAEFEQRITDWKNKGQLTAEQKSLMNNQLAIKNAYDILIAKEKEVKLNERNAKIVKEVADDYAKYAAFTAGAAVARSEKQTGMDDQYARELTGVDKGDRLREQLLAERAIRREFAVEQRKNTAEASADGTLGSEQYYQEVTKIKAALNDALQAQQDYFNNLKTARESWSNGMSAGFDNFIDKASDVAGAAKSLTENSLKSFGDELTNLATGGETNFKSFFATVLKGIANMIIQFTIMIPIANALKSAMNMSSSGGGFFSKLLGLAGGSSTTATGISSQTLSFGSGSSLFGGAFADGGTPPMGKVSLVGERGPELFIPKTQGTIIPNNALGGSNVVQNFNLGDIYVQGGKTNDETAAALNREMVKTMQGIAKQQIMQEQRPGGLLRA